LCTGYRTQKEVGVATKASYSRARQNLAAIWNEVENSREPAILERRGHEDMALVPADELSSLQETAHLLRSPKNAARLLAALVRSQKETTAPTELEVLMKELGLSE
jgi:antitoxin YefM